MCAGGRGRGFHGALHPQSGTVSAGQSAVGGVRCTASRDGVQSSCQECKSALVYSLVSFAPQTMICALISAQYCHVSLNTVMPLSTLAILTCLSQYCHASLNTGMSLSIDSMRRLMLLEHLSAVACQLLESVTGVASAVGVCDWRCISCWSL